MAGFKLALFDPKGHGEPGIVPAYFLDEALCVRSSDEHLEGVAEGEVG